jgi:predicted NBD/HSP70 family sugar kinase
MVSARKDPPWSWPRLQEGQRTVLLDVLVNGSRSRAELARRTGLSRTSLTRLTRDLLDFGFVAEGETEKLEGRGRPSEIVHLLPGSAQFLGIKLTGDTLYAAVIDLHATVLETEEHPLESRSLADVIGLIGEVAERVRPRHPRLAAAGVCLAGDIVQQVDGRSAIVESPFLGWKEVPLESLVETATGLPTAISNDVQALTLAHHWFGAGVGCHSLAVIGLGEGIGSGLVVGDELVRGARGHPGKVGHIPMTDHGPSCDRGHVGCVSAFVTIPAILRNAGTRSLDETIDAARAGDARADAALGWAATALGVVVAQLANLVDPEKVIVTGEGLAIAERRRPAMDAAITRHLDPAAAPVAVELYPFRFADYAWAAAISAVRHIV